MAIFSPRWPSLGPPAVRFTHLYPALTRSEPVDFKFRPTTNILSTDFGICLYPARKTTLSNIWETYNTSSVVLFYDPIFEYFSTYFWLYHPGDPDHSELYARFVYKMIDRHEITSF